MMHNEAAVDWRTVCVVQVTRDMPTRENVMAVSRVVRAGAAFVQKSGTSCVCTARNIALTEALDKCIDRKTMLLIDDDIIPNIEQVSELVSLSQQHDLPYSGRYVLADGSLSLLRVSKDRWYAGLGFIAIPTHSLQAVAGKKVRISDTIRIYPLCTAGADGDDWYTDDFSLCKKLGGVVVANIDVAHRKPIELFPAERQSLDDD